MEDKECGSGKHQEPVFAVCKSACPVQRYAVKDEEPQIRIAKRSRVIFNRFEEDKEGNKRYCRKNPCLKWRK